MHITKQLSYFPSKSVNTKDSTEYQLNQESWARRRRAETLERDQGLRKEPKLRRRRASKETKIWEEGWGKEAETSQEEGGRNNGEEDQKGKAETMARLA